MLSVSCKHKQESLSLMPTATLLLWGMGMFSI